MTTVIQPKARTDQGRSGVATGDAEHDAERLLSSVWAVGSTVLLPIDPVRIARDLGLDVYVSELDPDVAGVLMKTFNQDAEIYLNGQDSKGRQRFTCAHELGHFMQRTAAGDFNYGYVDRRDTLASLGADRGEVYANRFAAALLMPKDIVKRHRKLRLLEQALLFDVSEEAMTYRLNGLCDRPRARLNMPSTSIAPARRYYQLTDKGREVLTQALSEQHGQTRSNA